MKHDQQNESKSPEKWSRKTIGDLCDFSNGYGFGPRDWSNSGLPIIRIQNLNGSQDFNYFSGEADQRWIVEPETILFAWAGTRGVSFGPAIWRGTKGVLNQHIYRIHPRKGVDPNWLYLALRHATDRIERLAHGFKSTLLHVSKSDITEQIIDLPPLPEQRKIADILSTWDEALSKLDALVEAEEQRKRALLKQLLSGRTRLKGFDQSNGKTAEDRFGIYPADWSKVRLGEITREVPTRNASGTSLPVLSCTKHRGLVLSDEYFGKQIYADDTSGYRVVCRGEFAYATNHIEEGSIGYQTLCDAGLVSPIYTVFKTTEVVDDRYLFRVLKSPLLLHFYQINTSASVDRRGSLRYGEFARMSIWLPTREEQSAIADVFEVVDQQLVILRSQRAALEKQKRGMMQRLLTGSIRVKQNQTET